MASPWRAPPLLVDEWEGSDGRADMAAEEVAGTVDCGVGTGFEKVFDNGWDEVPRWLEGRAGSAGRCAAGQNEQEDEWVSRAKSSLL